MIKNLVLIFTIFLLSFSLVLFAYLLKNEDLCCRYEICRTVTNMCEEEEDDGYTILESENGVKLYIEDIQSISLGDTVKGKVSGSWFFEGEFPVRVLDEDMELISTLVARADYWMTSDTVPFQFDLDFELEESSELTLRFEKSNPSDMIENADHVDWKVKINVAQETMVVNAFFPNSDMGSLQDCSKVYPVQREIVRTTAVGRRSLEELIMGVNESESDQGYFNNVNAETEILSLTISNGIARVDFSSDLEDGVGGSCMVQSIRAQIESTLKQFSTVQEVVISIDGRTEDILQP